MYYMCRAVKITSDDARIASLDHDVGSVMLA